MRSFRRKRVRKRAFRDFEGFQRRGLHLLDAHRDLGHDAGEFSVAERMAREELSLPVYAELTDAEIERIAGVVRETAARAHNLAAADSIC